MSLPGARGPGGDEASAGRHRAATDDGAEGARREDSRDAPVEGPGAGAEPDGSGRGICELCGGPTRERHCKVVCLNCGFRRDCSDP